MPRWFLAAGLVDEVHVVVPVLLGRGERLFADVGAGPASAPGGDACAEVVASSRVAHVRMVRAGA